MLETGDRFADVKVRSGGCNNAYPGPGGNPVLHPDGQETAEFKRVWAAVENLMGSRQPDLTWQEKEALATVMPRVNIRSMTAKNALEFVWAKGNATVNKLMAKGDESLAPLEYRYDMKKHRPPVNYSAKSVTVATAFTEILKQQGLDYVVQEGNIAIVEAAKNP